MSETKKTDTVAEAAVPKQASAPEERDVLLKVEGLTKHFPIKKGILQRQVGAVKAVDGLDFEVRKGETLGVVGESGCGKSTMGRVITRLQDPTGGKITFEGQDITRLNTGQMRPLRRDIQMIFQDPYGSLNPRHTIGSIVSAPFRLQGVEPEGGVKKEVQRLLDLVGLSPEHYNRYPHEFSGGQRQRIGIARALALKPKLVVADEPVSALDVSIQAQVVNLMDDLQQELGLTYVIIAHDLSVVRHVSDRIAVMYLGKIVELADRVSLYESPMHPYTKALMSAVPVPDPKRRGLKSERILLRGDVPSPIAPPSGCRFHTRCWKATQICKTTEPQLVELRPGQRVACHHPENFADQAPQDTVLLTAAKEASELVPDAVLSEGAAEKEPASDKETAAEETAAAEAAAASEAVASDEKPAVSEEKPASEKEAVASEEEPTASEDKPAASTEEAASEEEAVSGEAVSEEGASGGEAAEDEEASEDEVASEESAASEAAAASGVKTGPGAKVSAGKAAPAADAPAEEPATATGAAADAPAEGSGDTEAVAEETGREAEATGKASGADSQESTDK
ncbi:dipeptide ABC transporter ATP-binding protein [Streptomyces olivaceoviridis]|uniref:Peptide ABC transporter ATP-binding protein n=1 Tax=Streptomyces canarius TaxID=285453 RepID=A0ABQ3D5L6_9ACTN|nr:dipeptide ABC transporter ATP-binding protein [Streptomyces canarius]GHA55865.1 peptide ABC transporter ATP-binding protein [Streptomyces canarius]